jgi:hypothetical protein
LLKCRRPTTKITITTDTAARAAQLTRAIVPAPYFDSGSLLTEFSSTEETVEFTVIIGVLVSFGLLLRILTVLVGGVLVDLATCLLGLTGFNCCNSARYDSSFWKYKRSGPESKSYIPITSFRRSAQFLDFPLHSSFLKKI